MNINQGLKSLGLNDSEIKVYIHLLSTNVKTGNNTAFKIASITKIPRGTVYLILEKLESKKLISSYKKNNVLHFLPENPNRFKIEIEEKMDVLDSLLPQLLKLKDAEELKSSVKTYTGDDGVKTVFEDIFDNPREKGIDVYHTISNPKLINHFPKSFTKKMDTKRKLNIQTKLITPHEVQFNSPTEYKNDSHREVRYLPKNFNFDGTMIIYGRKAALFSHKENEIYSVIIESTAIVDMLDAIFLCLWGLLPSSR
jgi:sugar-specific transcriptional regulator TrmB